MSIAADIDTPDMQSQRRTRRALLGAGLAAFAATLVSAFGRPRPVAASHLGAVKLGHFNTAPVTTFIANEVNDESAFEASTSGEGTGVMGTSDTGTGVWGHSNSAVGVRGGSNSHLGVRGESSSGTGVVGVSGNAIPGNQGRVGVFGRADHVTGRGVWGISNAGIGVRAESSTGYGLRVIGRARFSRSGKVTFSAGQAAKTISSEVLTPISLVLATIQGNIAGTWVRGVSVSAANDRFTIRLNKPAPSALVVGWFIVN